MVFKSRSRTIKGDSGNTVGIFTSASATERASSGHHSTTNFFTIKLSLRLLIALETQFRIELILNRTSRELKSQWEIAEKDFKVQLDSANTREETLKISRGLYRDNFHRFQTGRSNANDLFSDQDRLYQIELLAIQGWYAAHVSYLKLCRSVGLMAGQCRL